MFYNYGSYLANKSTSLRKLHVEEMVATIFSPGPFYYYILDSPTLTFENPSPSVMDIMGISIENEFLKVLMDRVHPDDIDFVLKCEAYVADFLMNKVSPDKIPYYKISYCIREMVKDGTYRLFMMQNITVSCTPEGALLKVLGVHTDLSHIMDTNNYKLSLTGLNGEPSYLGIDILGETETSDPLAENPLTHREIDVVRLVIKGYTAKQIAEILHLSEETIKTHKRNALKKTGSKNSNELIGFCIRGGLV